VPISSPPAGRHAPNEPQCFQRVRPTDEPQPNVTSTTTTLVDPRTGAIPSSLGNLARVAADGRDFVERRAVALGELVEDGAGVGLAIAERTIQSAALNLTFAVANRLGFPLLV